MTEKYVVNIWVKLILIFVANLLVAVFVMPVLLSLFRTVDTAVYSWILAVADAVSLFIALGLLGQAVVFKNDESRIIGRVFATFYILMYSLALLLSVKFAGPFPTVDLGLALLKILFGGILIYYVPCLIISLISKRGS